LRMESQQKEKQMLTIQYGDRTEVTVHVAER
jgi:hypothetical protein